MTIAVWIVSGLLALAFLFAGGGKLVQSKEKLEGMMPWVSDFSAWQVKAIGALEVLGAVGVILPALTGILPILSAFAAAGLALVQVGAFVVHVRRGETKNLPANTVLFLLAAFVAVTRFLGF